MIILKDVPGLTDVDIMGAISDMVPLAQIQTGHGGVVVDESTALVFLKRYFGAMSASLRVSSEYEPDPEPDPPHDPPKIDSADYGGVPQRRPARRGVKA